MKGMPTIRTLAKMAGVSSATISLALRNHPRIRASERERIQAIAAEVGYKTDPLMARLTTQLRTSRISSPRNALGMVFTAKERSDVELPTVQEWLRGCEVRAAQAGYSCDHFVFSQSEWSPEQLAEILEARGIQGLVTMGPFRKGIVPTRFDVLWRNCATVVVGDRPMRPALSYVANNQFSTSVHAMEEVARLGYRRPALCIHPHIDDVVERRFLAGFRVGSADRFETDWCFPVFDFAPGAEKRFQTWAKRHRPDVIVTLHQEIKSWLEKVGMGVPDQVGLVHLDRTQTLDGWAGMRQNNAQIGSAAVDLVLAQLLRSEVGVPPFQQCMSVSGAWVPGATVRQQNPPARKVVARKRASFRDQPSADQ